MADEKQRPKLTPPYLSYRTFRNYLEGLATGIPGRIDRSVLGNFSGIVQSQLLGTLQFFEMIDAEGHPTEFLDRVVSATPDVKKKLLTLALQSRYPFVFRGGVDLTKATTRQLHEQFEGAGISGDTVRKSVAFFIFAAKDAGIELSKFIKAPRSPRGAGARQTIRAPRSATNGWASNGNSESNQGRTPPGPPSRYQVLIEMLDPINMEEKEREAVWILLQYLKKREGGG